MASKNIIIAPVGNRTSIFKDAWLKNEREREFDICLLFYHEEIANPGIYNNVDYFYHLKGFKYHMIHRVLTEIHPEWLSQYEYFYFPDDDIEIDTRQINTLFALSKAFKASISCASLTTDSYCSWPMFKQKPNQFCRYVGQVEVMAPLFDAATLRTCLPTFIDNRSSWGMDSVWSKLLNYPEDKLIVFDAITMRHMHPVGKGELYTKLGTSAEQEWADIIAKYGARRHNYQEFGGLAVVNKNSNRLVHAFYRYKESFKKRKRKLKDFILKATHL